MHINATDTNATIHNGIYTCQATLIIAGVDRFIETADSTVTFTGTEMIYSLSYVRQD